MLNSIALSTDQKILFLIDDGDAVAYSLEEGDGVVLGLLGDQLTAATAHDDSATELPMSLNTATTQWQIMYIPSAKALYIIGVPKDGFNTEESRSIGSTDIDPGRSIGSTDIDPGRNIGSSDIDPGIIGEDDQELDIHFDLSTMVVILVMDGDFIKIKTQPK
jgi:hypothetical protein